MLKAELFYRILNFVPHFTRKSVKAVVVDVILPTAENAMSKPDIAYLQAQVIFYLRFAFSNASQTKPKKQ